MRDKVILPLKDNILRTWPEDNFLLSVIQNKESAYDWIMNFFIQTVATRFENGEKRITFYPNGIHHKKVNNYNLCPFIRKHTIPRNIVLEKYSDFSDFLIYSINNDLYISNSFDQQHIRMENSPFYHPAYIYGYDIKRSVFYVCDNFELGKYKSTEISFNLINEAYNLLDNYPWDTYEISTNLYEVIDYKFKFDLNLLVSLLNDYLVSRNSMGYLDNYIRPYDKNLYFGINCYNHFCDYLNEFLNNDAERVDLRSFVFLIDHKTLMNLRVKFLISKSYILNNEFLIKEVETLENDCKKVLSLTMKYVETRDNKIISKILKNLETIKKRDSDVIIMLLDELNKAK